ncbi:MAG: hypothetical protein H6Q52_2481 [Deltaproteobacteria bacterium]|nr:hypothetical protein [Deltaproteobacteria bacterium]
MLYNTLMKNTARDDDTGYADDMFQVYDPDNPPFIKLCICDIIRELPELTDEDVSGYHDD